MAYHKLVTLHHRLHVWKFIPLRYKPIRDKWVNTNMRSHSRSKLLNGENIRNVEILFLFRKRVHSKGKHAALLDCVWNVMAHAQKPDFLFQRNGRVHLNRRGRQFSRLLAAEVCASAVLMLDTPCSEVVWKVLATQPIHQFPFHFPSRTSPCAITFQQDSTTVHFWWTETRRARRRNTGK